MVRAGKSPAGESGRAFSGFAVFVPAPPCPAEENCAKGVFGSDGSGKVAVSLQNGFWRHAGRPEAFKLLTGSFLAMRTDTIVVFGVKNSPFGLCQLALNHRGVCFLGFVENADDLSPRLLETAAGRRLVRDDRRIAPLLDRAFSPAAARLELDLQGTPFQLRVWEALCRIPPGTTASYQEVAALSGRPRAVRAAANAVAANRIAWLIPCHRVIRKDGGLGGYSWGRECKRRMLEYECRQAAAGCQVAVEFSRHYFLTPKPLQW